MKAKNSALTPVLIDGREMVKAQDLHDALGVRGDHRLRWVHDRIERLGLLEGEDYVERDGGGAKKTWKNLALTPMAALEVAISERSFRESPKTIGLRRQHAALRAAVMELQPELAQALRYLKMTDVTDAERARLMGGQEQWETALQRLVELQLIAPQEDIPAL